MDKQLVLQTLIERVRADLATAEAAHRATREGTTHEESRAENDKDTRATESSYLARGQARRVAELAEALTRLEAMPLRRYDERTPIGVSALVRIEYEEGETAWYFLVPGGSGLELSVDGTRVQPITLKSPVGQALLGKQQDDDVEFRTPRGSRTASIAWVA